MTGKVDLKKTHESYQARPGEFRLLQVPPMQYLMLDGSGDPNSSAQFSTALETLYPVAYTLKFASKNHLGRDYVVPPLEGLWWADDFSAFTTARDKSLWSWRLMLLVPDWISPEMVEQARRVVAEKKAGDGLRLDGLLFQTLQEGLCVQTLHVGPFDEEGPVLQQMHHEFIPQHGLALTGSHHEIYLSDMRRTSPEKLRTILRQPVTDGSPENA
ncbi:GyrI-like domain-containing protein [Nesterenkonia rhizosphaerae]